MNRSLTLWTNPGKENSLFYYNVSLCSVLISCLSKILQIIYLSKSVNEIVILKNLHHFKMNSTDKFIYTYVQST